MTRPFGTGQRELHDAAGDLVIDLSELMKSKQLPFNIRWRHEEHPPVFGCEHFSWTLRVFTERVDDIEKATLWEMVSSKFFDCTAAQKSKID